VFYDNTNHKVAEREGNLGKVIGGSKTSIVEPSIETKLGATIEVHGREGTEAHNS
jgi:hypothetical protein